MIVEIVDPKKNETILDNACGTAGFLISAYKHILKENMDKIPGDKLNFDEKKEILKHITGYDIEPSMVRIAKMNMFLHGANNPDIYEYDTLSDDSRWEEKFNVILANPPFMTPKGGIKPHKRFEVKSNRSEVLFVDYINNHLRSDGRAGVIVPDGIAFQSGNAYKELRKNLIANSLIAIIALPSGIFAPYSGVRTDILILDKQKAKKTEQILFVELRNDGFSLNKQRNPIKENDIPKIIKIFKEGNLEQHQERKNQWFSVKKEEIIKNNYDLSINKYKAIIIDTPSFEDSKTIFNDILQLEEDSRKVLMELKKLL